MSRRELGRPAIIQAVVSRVRRSGARTLRYLERKVHPYNYRAEKVLYMRRRRREPGPPVVVYSMGKSGNTAMVDAVRRAKRGPVFQVHVILDREHIAASEARYRSVKRSSRPRHVWDAECLLERPPTLETPWRVVSMVREPLGQVVSAFFQTGARQGYLGPNTTLASLLDLFGDRWNRLPLLWFESHFVPSLGVDVYGQPFDRDRGYSVIDTPAVRVLLMRRESLGVAPEALSRFLGTAEPVPVPRLNVGAEKVYGDLYEAFLRQVRPPPEAIERAYSSRLVRHFYRPDQIEAFRHYWGSPRPLAVSSSAGLVPPFEESDT